MSFLRIRGFTLIEVMVVVAIIAILATVAVPAYTEYIRRGNLADASNGLATVGAQMERYFQDNRQYTAIGAFVPPCAAVNPDNSVAGTRRFNNFTINCVPSNPAETTFTIEAVGGGPVAGFIYRLNHRGVRETVQTPPGSGYVTCATQWILKKGAPCV
jgi:type IV pilus assembly protein PilE